jgi:hypothetical protein
MKKSSEKLSSPWAHWNFSDAGEMKRVSVLRSRNRIGLSRMDSKARAISWDSCLLSGELSLSKSSPGKQLSERVKSDLKK